MPKIHRQCSVVMSAAFAIGMVASSALSAQSFTHAERQERLRFAEHHLAPWVDEDDERGVVYRCLQAAGEGDDTATLAVSNLSFGRYVFDEVLGLHDMIDDNVVTDPDRSDEAQSIIRESVDEMRDLLRDPQTRDLWMEAAQAIRHGSRQCRELTR